MERQQHFVRLQRICKCENFYMGNMQEGKRK